MQLSIIGAGESGVGAAILAKRKGFDVFVSDVGEIKGRYKSKLRQHGIPYEEGKHSEDRILASKEVVKSPGVPDKAPLIGKLKRAGIPVVSEIEFASRYTDAKIIGITGSNGKTTTTLLCHHLLKSAGYNVGLAGNVGYSFAEQVAKERYDYFVLEISSFQLDDIQSFRPDVGILLNITPDHLDRYAYRLENYAASKLRIMMNQSDSDTFIFNALDGNIISMLNGKAVRPKCVLVSRAKMDGGILQVGESRLDASRFSLKGEHNMFNATCAILAAQKVGVSDESIQAALPTFRNAEHRMEFVAEINGVTYINDSKATNVEASFYALQAQNQPVIWVVGGTDKGNDYEPLSNLVRDRVKAIICLGLDNRKLLGHFSSICKIIEETQSAEMAVQRANIYAEAGDVVLLSPACASFDLFDNYEHRGQLFKMAVNGSQ